jgi:hypothetical protein
MQTVVMQTAVTSLLEWQRALRTQLLAAHTGPDGQHALEGLAAERLAIYRNTCVTTLVNALQLNFPAVRQLVGDEFFEGTARQFMAIHPPASAYLNDYGEHFAAFLADFAPAAAITYLADVARLEWAVSRVLHAPDEVSLDLNRLTTLDPQNLSRLRFRPRAAVNALCLTAPADTIWRAVLAQDDKAMAAIAFGSEPVYLLIERIDEALSVQRLPPAEGRFIAALVTGQTLAAAIDAAGTDSEVLLAGHLRAGRFVDFNLT